MSDIEDKLGTASYNRLRIGISSEYNYMNQIEYVLGKLTDKEYEELSSIFPKIYELIISFVMNGVDFTMNHYNSKK